MPEKRLHTEWNTFTLVSLGALVAIQLILTRFLAINIGGFGRIQLGTVAVIMAGIWFGPLGGALTGFTADILGCLLQGYAPNPMLTVAAMLWGVIPALFLISAKAKRRMRILFLCIGVVISSVCCTLILTTAGLVLFLGYSLPAILPTRVTQFFLTAPIYCLLVNLLYFSPVTSYISRTQQTRLARRQSTVR